MLTIVEDFIRATWTYLMTHKSQTYSIINQNFHMVQTTFQTSVQTLRFDNGLEFLSLPLQTLFYELGVTHHKSCVYTITKWGS